MTNGPGQQRTAGPSVLHTTSTISEVAVTQVRQARLTSTRMNRIGYLIAVLVNVAGFVLLNLWPGWQTIPFLTGDTPSVLAFVDAALVVGIAANLVQLLGSPGWPTAAGSLVTTAMSLAAMVRVLQVFPFDVSDPWPAILRAVLIFAIVGATLGILALVASLMRLRQVEGR
jgi:hypothetical protein